MNTIRLAILGEVGEDNGATISEVAVPLLMNMVKNGDGFDQYAALKSLRGFGPHATEAIPILRANLASPDVQKTWIVAEALGRMKGSAYEAVPDLVKVIKANQSQCLNDPMNICRYAAQALGNIGPAAKDAIPDLISLLDHQNPYVRIYAAVALIRIQPKNQEALHSMSSLLKDQNVDVRRYTLWRLEDIGKEAKPAKNVVEASMSDSDEEVRNAASKVLKALLNN